MGSNSLITFASIEEHKESLFDKEQNLGSRPECCIYRVPKAIRKTNEEAYTPQVISIGPLHHDNPELAYMEKQKIRFKTKFSERNGITPEMWQEFVSFIQNHEQSIRNCYEESSNLPKLEFVTMILYDAVFIIELFLKYFERVTARSALPFTRRLMADIMLDLVLLENQLPYLVLENLYMIAFPDQNVSFLYLSCLFFKSFSNGVPNILRHVDFQLKHFTDLKRYLITMRFLRPKSKGSPSEFPYCALKLQESGVKFKHVKEECLLNIAFIKKRQLMIPWLEVHELHIPQLNIFDQTETLFRNLMALEQCHYPEEAYVCQYIILMGELINTKEDVNLLAEAGILSNHVGDNVKVANMFNKLGENICLDGSCYCDVFKEMKAHYDSPWNHAVATLKSVYFIDLWRGTGTVAAILFLVLTFIQTVCSVLQVK